MDYQPGDLRRTGRGAEVMVVAPDRCGSGHPLTPGKVKVGHEPCTCKQRGHATWTCTTCWDVVYGRPCEKVSSPGR